MFRFFCACACARVHVCVCLCVTERETDRQTETQTDRHRQTYRNRETERDLRIAFVVSAFTVCCLRSVWSFQSMLRVCSCTQICCFYVCACMPTNNQTNMHGIHASKTIAHISYKTDNYSKICESSSSFGYGLHNVMIINVGTTD